MVTGITVSDFVQASYKKTQGQSRPGFRARVLRESQNVILSFRAAEKEGQSPYRQIKEVIQNIISTDYDGRTIIELLQNGHDANASAESDGRLEFVLVEDEESFGVLYVANTGTAITDKNFESICQVASSSKSPNEGIGNKGVGFKSILQLGSNPEIYSRSHRDSPSFDGYCFRFANSCDIGKLAIWADGGDRSLSRRIEENVSSLQLPVPLTDQPPMLKYFQQQGYVTVVRIPFHDAKARSRAETQLEELASSKVPINLFLNRLKSIKIVCVSDEGKQETTLLGRESLSYAAVRPGLRIEQVRLEDGQVFVIASKTIPAVQMREAIAASRAARMLSDSWDAWEGDGLVSVALSCGDPVNTGRLYAFLPMGDDAHAPLPGFVNAPFYAKLDRRSLDEGIALNDMLLTQAALLCAEVLSLPATTSTPLLTQEALMDMACWSGPYLEVMRTSLDQMGHTLCGLPLIPQTLGSSGLTSLSKGLIWAADDCLVFTAETAAQCGFEGIISEQVHVDRLNNLNKLAWTVLERELAPEQSELVTIAETVAAALAQTGAAMETWADFYDDLSRAVPRGTDFANRSILYSDDGRLLPTSGGETGLVVFTAATQARSALPAVPEFIRGRFDFLSSDIPSLATDNKRRPGRTWLLQHGLIREYATEPVLNLVGDVMRSLSGDDAYNRSFRALFFAYELWNGGRKEIDVDVVRQARLLLPTVSGWHAATDTFFGAGWTREYSGIDKVLAKFISNTVEISADLGAISQRVLLTPSEFLPVGIDVDSFSRFLDSAGANHGLAPTFLPKKDFRMSGAQVSHPTLAHTLWGIGIPQEMQEDWRATASWWSGRRAKHSGVTYSAESDVAALPGQVDWHSFDSESKLLYAELIVHGLEHWDSSVFDVRFARRSSDPTGVIWPSLLTSFLATERWLPQTTPGARADITFVALADGWWLKEIDAPDYLPAVPARLRKIDSGLAAQRLMRCGLNCWDDSRSSIARLQTLTEIVERNASAPRTLWDASIRKAYDGAWVDFFQMKHLSSFEPTSILISRQGRLEVVRLDSVQETIYVPDAAGTASEISLRQAPVAMLPVREAAIAGHVRDLLAESGVTCLRDVSAAVVEILGDGLPVRSLTVRPLIEICSPWLPVLVVAVIEFCSPDIVQTSMASLVRKYQLLLETKVSVAARTMTTVDGVTIGNSANHDSFVVDDCHVLIRGSASDGTWRLQQSASVALADLVGSPKAGDRLRLALFELERRCGSSDPTLTDLAAVLAVTPTELEGLAFELELNERGPSRFEALLACVDPALAESWRRNGQFHLGPEAKSSWLREQSWDSHLRPEELVAMADGMPLPEALDELRISLPAANKGLRAVGLPPLKNLRGHEKKFTSVLQRKGAELHDRLRDRFIGTFESGDPMNEYLRLRSFPGLVTKTEWLEEFWELPEEAILAEIDRWLDANCPASQPNSQSDLLSVAELRQAGRVGVGRAVSRVNNMIDAWHLSVGRDSQPPLDANVVLEEMQAGGYLDFLRANTESVVRWLVASEQWPPNMPISVRAADAGLSEEDLKRAKDRVIEAEKDLWQSQSRLTYNDKSFPTNAAGLRELAEEIRKTTGREIAVQANVPAELATETTSVSPLTTSNSTPVPKQTRSRIEQAQLAGIGFVGEIIAGIWLCEHFGVELEECWFSGYRSVELADNLGDDGLGYDFRINTPEGTIYYEVKATSGQENQFELGETEVRRAGSLAKDEQFHIIFIKNVLDGERYEVYLLPNPQSPDGVGRYAIRGHSLRLQFELGAGDSVSG